MSCLFARERDWIGAVSDREGILCDEQVDELRALADDIRIEADTSHYGYFLGGDPREFTPDAEVCTAEEMERHKADCEAWERGEQVDRGGPHELLVKDERVVGWATVSSYGMGMQALKDEALLKLAQDLDDWIDRARQVLP
jgi:hypothetical protein